MTLGNILTNRDDIGYAYARVEYTVLPHMRQQEPQLTDIVEPAEKQSNGWGGKREGSGRKPVGRPRIEGPRPWDIEDISRQAYYRRNKAPAPAKPKIYATKRGRGTPVGPVVTRMVMWPDGKWRPGIKTSGSLSQFEQAWVYVGVRKDGLVKIGMSRNVPQRCAQLGLQQFFAHPVVPGLARTLESMALRRLGALKGGTEHVMCKPEDAAAAVMAARNELSMLCHADPNETAVEAYTRRIGLAA